MLTRMSTRPSSARVRSTTAWTSLLVAHVAGERERPHAQPVELARGLLAALDLAGAEDEVGAGLGETGRHLAADPAAAAGDDRDLAGQVEELAWIHRTSSAIVRSVAASCAWIRSVVTGDAFHASSRSATRSRGPTSATSSTSASGTFAIASIFLPPR